MPDLNATIPVEFPYIGSLTLHSDDPGWPGLVPLYECSLCKALLKKDGAQAHADWHGNERMRNFGGF